MSYQNFDQIIKEEWEKEFSFEGIDETDYESSLFSTYKDLVKRISIRVWNEAIDTALDNVEVITDSSETFQSIDDNSVLKFKIDET